MSANLNQRMGELKAAFRNRKPVRTGSLIVTLFGDSVAPRGGSVSLGSLINACGLVGIGHRLVRTAVYRLVQDGVLDNKLVGRRSYYALTSHGKRDFDKATQRIYSDSRAAWEGMWCIVLIGNLETDQRTELRKQLAWQGFGTFGSDTLAHPNPDKSQLQHALEANKLRDQVVVLDAQLPPQQSDLSLRTLIKRAWDLPVLESAYTGYINAFSPCLIALRGGQTITNEDAFVLRTFMIHEYRKVLLRDPNLPEQLLPSSWRGTSAYQLSQQLYELIVEPAEAFVDDNLENLLGPLPKPVPEFARRFQ